MLNKNQIIMLLKKSKYNFRLRMLVPSKNIVSNEINCKQLMGAHAV